MSDITQWSPTDANNNAAPPDGFPEGQPASSINDCSRAVMGAVRRHAEDGGWFDWGHTATRVSDTVFQVPGDLSAVYAVNRRVRIAQTATIYGTITQVDVSANTDVTVALDSGAIAAEAMAVSVADEPKALSPSGFGSAASKNTGTAVGDVVELEDVSGSAGLPAVDGSQLTGLPLGYRLLDTSTPSNSPSVAWTTAEWFTSYSRLLIAYERVIPAVNGANLWVRVSRDGGSTWLAGTNYRDANLGVAGNGTSFADSTQQDRHGIAGDILNVATDGGVNGTTEVYSIGVHPMLISHAVWPRLTAGLVITGNVVYCNMNDGAIDGLQVLCSSGNILSGTLRLYGIL